MRKNIKIILVMMCFIICILLCSCSGKNTTNSQEKVDNNESNDVFTLRVAMECAYSPFNWTQESSTVGSEELAVKIYDSNYYAYGYDVMLAKEICDYYGWNLEIHKVEWSNIILGLQSGEYDVIIGGMKKTAERDETVDFSNMYFNSENCLIVSSDSQYVGSKSLDEVAGISCTAQINTAMADCISEIPNVKELPLYSSLSEGVMAVTNKAADACVLSIINAKIAAQTNNIEIIQFDEGKGFTQDTEVCMAVKEGNFDLQNKLNEALVDIKWNDKMDSYMNKAIEAAPVE